jgi:tetratricopeptide (TPR) repeat protein
VLAELVMRCLSKDPDDRPQSAADLVRVLETATSGGGHSAMPAILFGGRRRIARALALYAVSFVAVAVVAKAAIGAVGLPDWVFPGALIVMALGLPVLLFTAFVHHGTHRALTAAALTSGGSPAAHSTFTKLAVKASPWVTWRRATMGGVTAMGAFALLVVAFMALRALGIGPAGSLLAAGKLAQKEPLLVADFRARGADSTLGSVVTEAVRTGLGQSSAVSIVPTSAVSVALGRMERPDTSPIDLALAREIAQREGIKAIVDGDVTPLGGGYVVAVRLVSAETGDELASYRETADGPKELLPTIDQVTRELRGKIGESLKAVRASPPLEQVTTPSLPALRKYVAGAHANDYEADYPKAIALLREAVALDTTFAMAYRKLGHALANGRMPVAQSDSAFAKAYRYRGRLTERERYLAIGSYFWVGPGHDRQQAAAAYAAVVARDSLDDAAVTDLAIILEERREFARAEPHFRRLIAASRAGGIERFWLTVLRIGEGRLAAAESSAVEARASMPGNAEVARIEALLPYARGHMDTAQAGLARMRVTEADADNRAWATRSLGNLALVQGKLAEATRLYADAWAQDTARGAPPPPLAAELRTAWLDTWFREQPRRSVEALDSALTHTPLHSVAGYDRPYLAAARLYALAGRSDRARALVARYEAEVKDSALRRENQPELHNTLAEIALAENKPLDAAVEFRRGDHRPDGPANDCTSCLPINLARAYDRAGMPDSAIALFERYVATPDWERIEWYLDPAFLAGTYKRLGELYEAKGDRQKAAGYYLKFVELWKDADLELQPKVAEVRQRLAHLRDLEAR